MHMTLYGKTGEYNTGYFWPYGNTLFCFKNTSSKAVALFQLLFSIYNFTLSVANVFTSIVTSLDLKMWFLILEMWYSILYTQLFQNRLSCENPKP